MQWVSRGVNCVLNVFMCNLFVLKDYVWNVFSVLNFEESVQLILRVFYFVVGKIFRDLKNFDDFFDVCIYEFLKNIVNVFYF